MPMNRGLLKVGSAIHRFWYELSGGRLAGTARGAQVVLLTTTGRKSGRPRTTPLFGMPDGESTIVVASYGGNDVHPAWYLNLTANPEAELRIGSERRRVRADTASDEEKARLWPRIVEMYSGYDDYQRETKRNIPVVILRPAVEN